jgi:hypothetical protein
MKMPSLVHFLNDKNKIQVEMLCGTTFQKSNTLDSVIEQPCVAKFTVWDCSPLS